MDEVVAECLKGTGVRFGALSGPTFAREVIHGRPSAAVLAGPDEPWRGELQRESSDEHLRLYTSSDIVGVELSGALKNVIAIAAGVAAGMELGPNAQSALITRGLHEITRLGMKAGADPETFRGLAGMGDLLLTCSSSQSRNYSVGRRLGQGERMESIVSGTQEVAEGVATADAAKLLAAHYGVEMPITDAVVRLLADEVSAKQVVRELMLRSLKTEAEL
jgi:glycerol-3-phosphate dehydrogenase (NAD(P)+)